MTLASQRQQLVIGISKISRKREYTLQRMTLASQRQKQEIGISKIIRKRKYNQDFKQSDEELDNDPLERVEYIPVSKHYKESPGSSQQLIEEEKLKYVTGETWGRTRLTCKPVEVQKFGVMTGFTTGEVLFDGMSVKTTTEKDGLNSTLCNLYEISNACEGGDSGELVFMEDYNNELVCIGIQNFGKLNKDFLESVKVVWDQAKNKLKSLEKLVPNEYAEFKRIVTEMELVKISQLIGNGWEMLGLTLGINDVKLEHIKADNPTMAMQIFKMLTTWAMDIESKATVGKLYKAIDECSKLTIRRKEIKRILLN